MATTTSPTSQHAGRREHNALDRRTRRRRPGRVDALGVKHSEAPEQATLGAAGSVGVAVGDAKRRQRPAPDAGAPHKGSTVNRLLGGERQPEADLDARAHRHADTLRERSAVADRVAQEAPDGLVEPGEPVRGEAGRGVSACRHGRSAAGRRVVGVTAMRLTVGAERTGRSARAAMPRNIRRLMTKLISCTGSTSNHAHRRE